MHKMHRILGVDKLGSFYSTKKVLSVEITTERQGMFEAKHFWPPLAVYTVHRIFGAN